ncbi:MAG: Rpn family recombination-promoting nuclease/putative transposase [Spirochaetales bacterium]|nr:Rpn family recombination-promoting nuclease/putative transposase [Spirochaetales bacterium]
MQEFAPTNETDMENPNKDWRNHFSPKILKAAEKAAKLGRPIDLTDDIVFKMFFAGDTPESKKCLCSFLSAVIGTQVTQVEVVNSEILPDMIKDKSSRLDIHCVLENGDKADIELQCSNQNDSQRNRALFYGSKLVSDSLTQGEPYNKMKKSYQIMVTNYKEFDDDDFFTKFGMYSVEKKITLSDRETIYFIELPKLRKFLKCDFENITPLQFWAILIKYSKNHKILEKLRETSKYKEDSAMADMVMSRITDDMRAWAIRLSREGGEIDRITQLAAAEEKGSHTAKIEIARSMIEDNFPYSTIIKHTGLSLAEIQELQ